MADCKHVRAACVSAKCSDLCWVKILNRDGQEHDGYVPDDMGIGGGDYVDFNYCLDCGQIQGKWPLPTTQLERET
jgi:hypothetical protein